MANTATTSYPAATGLRTKLVLSYFAVIVSSIIVLSFAVSWAVQNYLAQSQQDHLRDEVGPALEKKYVQDFLFAQGNWTIVQSDSPGPVVMAVIYDTHGNVEGC